jgi:hypothetical protein
LGRHRWVIERALAWFSRFHRLTICYGVSAKGYKSGSQRPYRWGETS